MYQYDLKFRSTKAHSNADGFSKLPLQGQAIHSLKASKNDSRSLSTKLSRFLITYRNIPSSTTDVSPAGLFMIRSLCTRLVASIYTEQSSGKASRSEALP